MVAQRRYAKAIDTTALGTQPSSSAIAPEPGDADRVTRKFYDAVGLLRAELDAENYLTEYVRDAAGRVIAQTRYATPVAGRFIHAAALTAQLEVFKAVNEVAAFTDLVALIRSAEPALREGGFDAVALLRAWTRNLAADAPIRATLASLGVLLSGSGTAASDIYLGDGSNNSFSGGSDIDRIDGGAGNDSLNGNAGNDTLDGGAGNDTLSGDAGADTYLFGLGSGQDTINNYDSDALGTNADTIVLGAGITPTNVTLSRSGSNLVISVSGTEDRLTINSYFVTDGTSQHAVETIRFADGSSWSIADVKAR
ncbi:calcium-binding protein, partial [Methylibium rhizosphaerae]|uniref:calcium-binding protein n=1 Tax=Methylibium rhizosphaerae TaxID=2570323 RepID=UPI002482FAA2